jgi:uncharacterized RDD family membrane protein YckC
MQNREQNFESGITDSGLAAKPATLVYAGFWLRFLAGLLDLLLLVCFIILLGSLVAALIAVTGGDSIVHNDMAAQLFYGLIVFLFFTYRILMEASAQGGTLGKQWMNLRVTDSQGNRLTIARAAWRLLVRPLSYLTLGIGFLLQPFTSRKQALHDLLAGTVVVQTSDSNKISIKAIGVVLFVALMLPLLAIFATAGLPVFQQYIQDVQLEKGIKIGQQASTAVSRFYRSNGHVPAAIGDAGGYISASRHVAGIDINPQNGELTVTFSTAVRKPIRDKHLIFTPALAADHTISWKCHSNDIEAQVLPDLCK